MRSDSGERSHLWAECKAAFHSRRCCSTCIRCPECRAPLCSVEYSGFWNPKDPRRPGISDDSTFGVGRVFLGCHSSRVLEVEERAGLAICYGADVIEEICRTKHGGSRFPRAPETSN